MSYDPAASQDSITVAAFNSPDRLKKLAHPYVCDGSGDHSTIRAAATASLLDQESIANPRYAGVRFAGGDYSIAGALPIKSRGFAYRSPGAGAARIHIESGAFDTAGMNDDGPDGVDTVDAVFMLEDTESGRNAVAITIDGFFIDATPNAGTSVAWFDGTDGGNTGPGSEGAYGTPTAATDGDTYFSIARLRGRALEYGVGFWNGSGNTLRGNNVYDTRFSGISKAAYYTQNSSDNHFNQTHAITDSAAGAIGYRMGGGNQRLTGAKAAYFLDAGSWAFDFSGSRGSAGDIEAQDSQNGVRISAADIMLNTVRVETQESPCTTAFQITAADLAIVVGQLYIHTRGSSVSDFGTYTNGLYLPTGGGTIGIGENDIHAFIDPANQFAANAITNPLRAGADLAPLLSSLAGSQGRGMYAIRVAGNPGRRLVSATRVGDA